VREWTGSSPAYGVCNNDCFVAGYVPTITTMLFYYESLGKGVL